MRRCRLWLFVVVLIGTLGWGSSYGQDVENLLDNGGFEDGVLAPWSVYGDVTAEVVSELPAAVVAEGPAEGRYCLHLVVGAAGANYWDSGLKHGNHVFEDGKHYTLSAFVKASSGEVQINFKPELDGGAYTGYGAQSFTTTDEWQEFSITTPVMSGDVDPAAITFHIGYNACEFWMDYVRFYEGDYVAPAIEVETLATEPDPESGATDVPRDVVLSWEASELAGSHNVYFGASYDDVNNADLADALGVSVSAGQTETTFDPEGLLEYGQTYYWRVDEVNATADAAVFKGSVWSFTVEPYVYTIENIVATASSADAGAGPENTINGSGLGSEDQHSIQATDMWLTDMAGEQPSWIQYEFDGVYKLYEMQVWNYNVQFELVLGYGVKDVTVEYSTDGVEWTAFGDLEFARATAKTTYLANTTIDLEGIAAKYVRLTVNSNWGGLTPQCGLSEVRFLHLPVKAREPEPADGAAEIAVTSTLDWRPGREVVSHEVYLSADAAAVTDGSALVGSVAAHPFVPDDLDFGTTYYWKVDEVNETASPSAWTGDVWSFSTREYEVVDDFESYDDEDNPIYGAWIDGWINGTGSTVGYLTVPFAEQTVVNSGRQSLPLTYDNSIAPYYSEASFDVGPADWTVHGADTLVVNFQGRAAVFEERADGSMLVGAGGADIWGGTDEFRFVYKQLAGNGSIAVRVDSLVRSNEWAKAGVMIRQNTNATAVNAALVVTPDYGVSFQYRMTAGSDSDNVAEAGPAAPYWVKLTRTDDVFTAQYSTDGVTWTDLVVDGGVGISMTGTVCIGLAVTSHDSDIMTNAEFSNVTTTGSVSGDWQVEAIGVDQPGNDADSVYVAIEDASGNMATVTYPDAQATQITTWQEWLIPFSDFAGVDMARVQTMYIGVGDRANPDAAGAGVLFVDDIGFGHPAD